MSRWLMICVILLGGCIEKQPADSASPVDSLAVGETGGADSSPPGDSSPAGDSTPEDTAPVDTAPPEDTSPPEDTAPPEPAPECGTLNTQLLRIPGGTFKMGSPASEPGRDGDETEHYVTLTHDLCASALLTTTQYYQETMTGEAYTGTEGPYPVEYLTWDEGAEFANTLSRTHGLQECFTCGSSTSGFRCSLAMDPYQCTGFRYPTEAEWEYLARAGTESSFYNGGITQAHIDEDTRCDKALPLDGTGDYLESIAYYCATSGEHPVAGKSANAWELYDIIGLNREYTLDEYCAYGGGSLEDPSEDPFEECGADERIIRGCGNGDVPSRCRAASRAGAGYDYSHDDTGVRLVRTAPD